MEWTETPEIKERYNKKESINNHLYGCLATEEREILRNGASCESLMPSLRPQPETEEDSHLRIGNFNEIQKISCAKSLLWDISRDHELAYRKYDFRPKKAILRNQSFLNSNLLYLIAATDGNEDTIGHSQLVARYTLMLTKALGIDDGNFSVGIERGALLHDIGKIGIPESVLRKEGPLTAYEREIIKEHPLIGYEMIKEFRFLGKAARVVLFHHESYDGQGYPFGLKGEEIPIESRIFAIADTLDAITSDRPYREGQSFRKAFDEIEKVRGSQFDPYLVDVFLSMPEEIWKEVQFETTESLRQYTIH